MDEPERCPVCQSDRYLNPSMKFLVNPECYHKMCESCVARIFTLGPAPCPVCGRQLRRNKFRAQTFEDVHIEREIDTRRRLRAIYNKTEDDFESLREYNDYLEDVELITFNLTSGIDVEETEKKIRKYEQKNKSNIALNDIKQQEERRLVIEAERLDKEYRLEQARIAREQIEFEQLDAKERNAEMLSAMQAGANYKQVVRRQPKRVIARRKIQVFTPTQGERSHNLYQPGATSVIERALFEAFAGLYT